MSEYPVPPFPAVKHEGKGGHAYEIACLEAKIKDLCGHLEAIANTSDMQEMLGIIHLPGWTTPVELQFANVIIDSIQGHASSLTEMRKALLCGSRAVELNPQPLPPG